MQGRTGVPEAHRSVGSEVTPSAGDRESPRSSPATGDRRSSVDLPTLMAPPGKSPQTNPLRLYDFAFFVVHSVFFFVLCGSGFVAPRLRRDKRLGGGFVS